MNPWHFILGAYGVTALLVVVEVVAVRMRRRAAETIAENVDDALHDERAAAADSR